MAPLKEGEGRVPTPCLLWENAAPPWRPLPALLLFSPTHTHHETTPQVVSYEFQAENLPYAPSVCKQRGRLLSLQAFDNEAGFPLGEADELQLDSVRMRR